jgi:hypothetical protein
VFTSDIRSELTALLQGTGLATGANWGAAAATSSAWGASSFEATLTQVLLKLLDRLEASSPTTPDPTTSPPGRVADTTPRPTWIYPTRTAAAAAAQQSYASQAAAQPAPAAAATSRPAALAFADFPRPPQDNGRGMHWIPTVAQSPEAIDRYVGALKDMHIKWVTFLNDGANIGANDYLVRQLKANGIEPILRVYTPGLQPVGGDLGAMVKHYRQLGVSYFQLYNEPNHSVENDGQMPDVDRYLDVWIPAAKTVLENGGLPGFGALSPGGEFKDTDFLGQAIDGLRARGALQLLDRGWLSIHNYQGDRPVDDAEGFTRFKVYADVLQQKLGRLLPMIGTEGGTFVAGPEDEPRRIKLVTDAYRYMAHREPYNFAYSYWVIANAAGGGHDPAWESQALFHTDGQSPLVGALAGLA